MRIVLMVQFYAIWWYLTPLPVTSGRGGLRGSVALLDTIGFLRTNTKKSDFVTGQQ